MAVEVNKRDDMETQGITIADVLAEELEDQTLDLPLTKHLILRITPPDWKSGTLVFYESIYIKPSAVGFLKKKLQEAAK